jgi:hypothetical protein
MKVSCCGDRYYSKELADNLTTIINDLQIRFPKFTEHLKGLKGIYIYDDFLDDEFKEKFKVTKSAMGFYSSITKEIYLASNYAYNQETAIRILFHELGHHLVQMRVGIDPHYNVSTANRAYLKEEIKAEKYALFIIDRFFVKDYPIMLRFLSLFNKFEKIKDEIIWCIDDYKSRLANLPKPISRYYSYSSFGSTTTTSTAYSWATVSKGYTSSGYVTGTGYYKNVT